MDSCYILSSEALDVVSIRTLSQLVKPETHSFVYRSSLFYQIFQNIQPTRLVCFLYVYITLLCAIALKNASFFFFLFTQTNQVSPLSTWETLHPGFRKLSKTPVPTLLHCLWLLPVRLMCFSLVDLPIWGRVPFSPQCRAIACQFPHPDFVPHPLPNQPSSSNLVPSFLLQKGFFFFNLFIYLTALGLSCIMRDLPMRCTGSLVVVLGVSCSMACEILVPYPGVKPLSSALQNRFLTTRPSGNSLGGLS